MYAAKSSCCQFCDRRIKRNNATLATNNVAIKTHAMCFVWMWISMINHSSDAPWMLLKVLLNDRRPSNSFLTMINCMSWQRTLNFSCVKWETKLHLIWFNKSHRCHRHIKFDGNGHNLTLSSWITLFRQLMIEFHPKMDTIRVCDEWPLHRVFDYTEKMLTFPLHKMC